METLVSETATHHNDLTIAYPITLHTTADRLPDQKDLQFWHHLL
jgi:hypothetical protein